MDEITMRAGLLMEAAQANQKLAESSLKKLKLQAQEIALLVREEVRRALVQELLSVSEESKRAAQALHGVKRAAGIRVLIWSVGITALCSLIPLALMHCIVPSRSEIQALRAKHDELVSRIALLEGRGARVDLRRCGPGARLCVRVDRSAPAYGEQSDYLVVRGY